MPRRVFLCDDHAVVRAGLKALLDQEPGLSVVGEAGDGVAAVEEIIALRPDVALLDITMPGIDGLEVAHRCAAGRPAAGADHARRLRLPLPGPRGRRVRLRAQARRRERPEKKENKGDWGNEEDCHILPHAESPHGMFGMVSALVVEK